MKSLLVTSFVGAVTIATNSFGVSVPHNFQLLHLLAAIGAMCGYYVADHFPSILRSRRKRVIGLLLCGICATCLFFIYKVVIDMNLVGLKIAATLSVLLFSAWLFLGIAAGVAKDAISSSMEKSG